MKGLCIKCKGRRFCGKDFCQIYAKANTLFKTINKISDNSFSGSSPPSVFVGHNFYPNLNVGILAPPEESEENWLYDAPKYWSSNDYDIKKIIELRSSLINSRFKSNIFDVRKGTRFLEIAQEVGISSKPVDIEVKLNKKPNPTLNFDMIGLPMGPVAKIEQIRVNDNPKIDNRVDKVINDDMLAVDSVIYLYKKGFDENVLSKLLSIGVLGLKKNKKLVPTRWSISGVDDILGKNLMNEIKDCMLIDEYRLYFGNYLGNYYIALILPYNWCYELFESYMPDSLWNPNQEISTVTDYETYFGRKTYAENTVGGYYAARIGVLEHLAKIKRQATVLLIRFVTSDYNCPLGVFVCREAVRKTMQGKYFVFNNKEDLIKYAKEIVKQKFNWNLDITLNQSRILNDVTKQRRLSEFYENI